jgi:hypothetical protein
MNKKENTEMNHENTKTILAEKPEVRHHLKVLHTLKDNIKINLTNWI